MSLSSRLFVPSQPKLQLPYPQYKTYEVAYTHVNEVASGEFTSAQISELRPETLPGYFHEVILDDKITTGHFDKIIAIDIDDTLYDRAKSKLAKDSVIRFSDKFVEMIKKAKEKNALIVIVTARLLKDHVGLGDHYSNTLQIIKKLETHIKKTDQVSGVYFTHAYSKFFPLEYLSIKYNIKSSDILLIDDSPEQLMFSNIKFQTCDINSLDPFAQVHRFLGSAVSKKSLEMKDQEITVSEIEKNLKHYIELCTNPRNQSVLQKLMYSCIEQNKYADIVQLSVILPTTLFWENFLKGLSSFKTKLPEKLAGLFEDDSFSVCFLNRLNTLLDAYSEYNTLCQFELLQKTIPHILSKFFETPVLKKRLLEMPNLQTIIRYMQTDNITAMDSYCFLINGRGFFQIHNESNGLIQIFNTFYAMNAINQKLFLEYQHNGERLARQSVILLVSSYGKMNINAFKFALANGANPNIIDKGSSRKETLIASLMNVHLIDEKKSNKLPFIEALLDEKSLELKSNTLTQVRDLIIKPSFDNKARKQELINLFIVGWANNLSVPPKLIKLFRKLDDFISSLRILKLPIDLENLVSGAYLRLKNSSLYVKGLTHFQLKMLHVRDAIQFLSFEITPTLAKLIVEKREGKISDPAILEHLQKVTEVIEKNKVKLTTFSLNCPISFFYGDNYSQHVEEISVEADQQSMMAKQAWV